MIDHLIRLYRKAGQARPKQIDVVIAGAADTGLLAICANAAAAAGVEIMAKCRFNVLDRCPTPLALCERFGIRHRLSVKTLLFDVIADRPGPQADILIAHSLFRYLPQAKHVAVLKAMLDWLNPGGRMIFSVSVGWVSQPDSTGFGEMLRCGVASGKLVLPEPVERLLSRVSGGYDRRISNFDSFHAVRRLLEDAGAQTEFIEDMMRGRSRPQVRDAPKRTFAILANGL